MKPTRSLALLVLFGCVEPYVPQPDRVPEDFPEDTGATSGASWHTASLEIHNGSDRSVDGVWLCDADWDCSWYDADFGDDLVPAGESVSLRVAADMQRGLALDGAACEVSNLELDADYEVTWAIEAMDGSYDGNWCVY